MWSPALGEAGVQEEGFQEEQRRGLLWKAAAPRRLSWSGDPELVCSAIEKSGGVNGGPCAKDGGQAEKPAPRTFLPSCARTPDTRWGHAGRWRLLGPCVRPHGEAPISRGGLTACCSLGSPLCRLMVHPSPRLSLSRSPGLPCFSTPSKSRLAPRRPRKQAPSRPPGAASRS